MPDRHFYLLSHYICYSLFFLFSACWLQRNERNSLWENKGERSEVYCLLGRYLCHGILFTCSHITFVMVYSFYFLLAGCRRNEFNSLWGDKGKRVEVYRLFGIYLCHGILSQSRRLPPLSGGEWQQIFLSVSPISYWDKRSAMMRSDSVQNMSAYADQNHAPSLAVARLELLALTLYSCDGLSTMLTFFKFHWW